MLKGWALHATGLSPRLKDANIFEHDQGKQRKGAVVKVKKKQKPRTGMYHAALD